MKCEEEKYAEGRGVCLGVDTPESVWSLSLLGVQKWWSNRSLTHIRVCLLAMCTPADNGRNFFQPSKSALPSLSLMVDRLSGEMGLLFCLVWKKFHSFLRKLILFSSARKKVVLPKSLPSRKEVMVTTMTFCKCCFSWMQVERDRGTIEYTR
jgi:hypothetical protein